MMRRLGLGMAAVATVAAGVALAVFLANPDNLRDPTDGEIRAGILATVRPLAPADELERRISESLKADDPEEAGDLFDLADLLGITVDPALRRQYEEKLEWLPTLKRSAGAGAQGFLTGEGEGTAGTVGAVISDLTVIGDLRDATAQTGHYLNGEPVDEVVLALSAAGIGLTGAVLATGGVATPVKVGVSVAKFAHRTGRMTKGFSRSVVELARLKNTEKLQDGMKSLGTIGKAASPRGALTVMRSLEHVDDLPRAEKVAVMMGKPTAGLFKVAGRRVFDGFAKIAVRSAAAVWALGALIVSAVVGLLGLILSAATVFSTVMATLRLLRKAVRGQSAA
jgi:hypothetical protein